MTLRLVGARGVNPARSGGGVPPVAAHKLLLVPADRTNPVLHMKTARHIGLLWFNRYASDKSMKFGLGRPVLPSSSLSQFELQRASYNSKC